MEFAWLVWGILEQSCGFSVMDVEGREEGFCLVSDDEEEEEVTIVFVFCVFE
jgi:hypothetical protein